MSEIAQDMNKLELIDRNRRFAIDVLKFVTTLPKDRLFDGLVRQLTRCSTSIGANYRAACRAKSTADFINKLKITEEEADETNYFLDLLTELEHKNDVAELKRLLKESNELAAIYSASLITLRKNHPPTAKNRKSYIVNQRP